MLENYLNTIGVVGMLLITGIVVMLAVLGILIPWFIYRIKIYSKMSYLELKELNKRFKLNIVKE